MTLLDLPLKGTDPFDLFHEWFETAKSSESADPDAACLATTDGNQPSARMVLVRHVDSRGFSFFTNENSRKGQQMKKGAFAALCYYWKSQERQVRIEGAVENLTEEESDAYYASRPRGSRIGAWASKQSEILTSRETLIQEANAIEKNFEGQDIPRPPHWHGYRIVPNRIEFWQQGEFRLHDRFIFTRDKTGVWTAQRLYP